MAGLGEEDFDRLVQERYNRIEMEKDRTKLQTQIQKLRDHMNYVESLRNETQDKYQ